MLMDHLQEHGLSALRLFAVLSESQHPSRVDLLFVFGLAATVPLDLLVALQFAVGVVGARHRAREQQLLLRLAEELTIGVATSCTDRKNSEKQPP